MGRQGAVRENPTIMSTVPEISSQSPATRRVHDAERHPRLARELATLAAMFAINCRELHGKRVGLCDDCAALQVYATRRLDRCVFGDNKPTCAKCTVHCYSAEKREDVRSVMRFAGPRMMWRHPVLAVRHVLDGRRPAPALPGQSH